MSHIPGARTLKKIIEKKVFGAIQVLRNAVGGGGVSSFPKNSVTKVYYSTLLALRGGGGGPISRKKALRNT